MSESERPPLSPEDYEAILGAVLETARGRWFLDEYARRNRHAETTVLLEAIARLENGMRDSSAPQTEEVGLRREIAELADAVSRVRREIAGSVAEEKGLRQPQFDRAYDDVIATAERADKDIFNAAEHLQEIAWALRETQDVPRAAADLDRQAVEIYRASNQHAVNTQRVRAILGVLRFVEARMSRLVESWSQGMAFIGDEPLDSQDQGSIRAGTLLAAGRGGPTGDVAFVPSKEEDTQAREAPAPTPAERHETPEPAPPIPLHATPRAVQPPAGARPFEAIDALSPEQRLALFT